MPFFYDLDRLPPGENPARAAAGLIRLRAQLDRDIPAKTVTDRLLVATWNIQRLGGLARLAESGLYIAEILSRFDLIAIQEVRADLTALDDLRALLGPWWRYVVTDVTAGKAGNGERLAYLYDTRKLRFGGLAGEIVLPPVTDAAGETRPAAQLVRTPFLAGFNSGWFDFMIATVHLLYGKNAAGHPPRVEEVRQIASFLAGRTKERGAWSRNLILLGDFNIYEPDGPAFAALTAAGFVIDDALTGLPKTNIGKKARHYDQIAFLFRDRRGLRPTAAGVLDFYDSVYRADQRGAYAPEMGPALTHTRKGRARTAREQKTYYESGWRARQMSDHLLMWVELPVEFADAYLQGRATPA